MGAPDRTPRIFVCSTQWHTNDSSQYGPALLTSHQGRMSDEFSGKGHLKSLLAITSTVSFSERMSRRLMHWSSYWKNIVAGRLLCLAQQMETNWKSNAFRCRV